MSIMNKITAYGPKLAVVVKALPAGKVAYLVVMGTGVYVVGAKILRSVREIADGRI